MDITNVRDELTVPRSPQAKSLRINRAILILQGILLDQWTEPGDESFSDATGRFCPISHLAAATGGATGDFHDGFMVALWLGVRPESVKTLTIAYDGGKDAQDGRERVIAALRQLEMEVR